MKRPLRDELVWMQHAIVVEEIKGKRKNLNIVFVIRQEPGLLEEPVGIIASGYRCQSGPIQIGFNSIMDRHGRCSCSDEATHTCVGENEVVLLVFFHCSVPCQAISGVQ
jgi:hypothetical protein